MYYVFYARQLSSTALVAVNGVFSKILQTSKIFCPCLQVKLKIQLFNKTSFYLAMKLCLLPNRY